MGNLHSGMVSGSELLKIRNSRSKVFIYQRIHPELQLRYESEGWELDKELKSSLRIRKRKPTSEAFEDRVWMLFHGMGFTHLNRDRQLRVEYDETREKLTQQLDVLAIDDETILFVECKSSETGIKKIDLKKDIEAISGIRGPLINRVRKDFPDRKCAYIIATNNYAVSDIDLERMEAARIIHLNDESLRYLEELTTHLGHSARYQMLGSFFSGQSIGGMENRIPAIEGRMGGSRYYSFSIEPEKLLKIGYVLHRKEANRNLMPTYQRLIKKERLRNIRNFIQAGGYFPNSLVISIDTAGRDLQFDLSGLQAENSISRIGVLHLPQKYRSAYIIDGQHRLYGYSETKYASTNTIPVVAFVDLDKDEQVKLFMEINENQKSVSKNLRNTLNADLLWESTDYNQQRQALRLHVAQRLGEDMRSPLFGRVIIGENTKTPMCNITIDTIQESLKWSGYLSQFGKKNEIISDGTFDKGSNDETVKALLPFLMESFEVISTRLPALWNESEAEGGILVTNNSISGIIRVLNDIINFYIERKEIAPKKDTVSAVVATVEYMLNPIVDFYENLKQDQREDLKRRYGTGGKIRFWRTLQKAIADALPEFNPEGLDEYWIDNEMRFNEQSFKMIRDIELHLKTDFLDTLKGKYGQGWFVKGLPKNVYDQALKLAHDKNYEFADTGKTTDPWDCLSLIDYRNIAVFGSHWSELFEKKYTKPGEEKIPGGKTAKTEWMQRLNRIRNQNFHTYSVTKDEYDLLREIHAWLIK